MWIVVIKLIFLLHMFIYKWKYFLEIVMLLLATASINVLNRLRQSISNEYNLVSSILRSLQSPGYLTEEHYHFFVLFCMFACKFDRI